MRKTLLFLTLFLFSLALAVQAQAKPGGALTINLRTCIDAGDGACHTRGDIYVDGATVCLRQTGEQEHCWLTEDGELWIDSLPHGSYWARGLAPSGYHLVAITCTTFPTDPYSHCNIRDNNVHITVPRSEARAINAVNVNFLLALD